MKPDLEDRLRSYLARHDPPAGLEGRVRARALARQQRLPVQLLAAAAVLLLAIGLGIALSQVRFLKARTANPGPTPSAVTSASVKPSASPQPTQSTYPLLPPVVLRMINTNVGWAAGEASNRVLRTADGGAHWNDVTPANARAGTWIPYFLDANTAWIASSLQPGSPSSDYSVLVYRTSDGGRTWKGVGTVPSSLGFPSVLDFVDRSHGWLFMRFSGSAGPDGGAFYRTSDGGATWTEASQTDATGAAGHLPLRCFQNPPVFLTVSTGWLPGACNTASGPYLYVSHDAGQTWTGVAIQIPSGYPSQCICSVNDLRFSDSRDGEFVLDIYQGLTPPQDFLYTTTDGGATWQLGPLLPASAVSPFFLDLSQAWIFNGKAGTLLHTVDGGQHWMVVGGVPSSQVAMGFQFITADVGWALGAEPGGETILKTQDGGRSWTNQLGPE